MKSEPLTKWPPGFRRFFAYGALFELVLIACTFGLPDSSLAIEVTNFAIIVHFPLMMVMEGLGETGEGVAFVLVIGFLVMACAWGFMFSQISRAARWAGGHLTRKQKRAAWLVAGLGGLALLGMVIVSSLSQKPIPFESSPEVKAVVAGNNAFALDLYAKLRVQPGNLFFSPFSISSALAMTSAGARGPTEREMTNVLHLGMPAGKLHPTFQTLMTRMDRIQRWHRIVLKCANSLWCQRDYKFSADYLQLLRENYSAEANAVDFKQSPAVAADEINRWVNAKTSHRIASGIDPAQLSSLTRLVLSDAIYFKGKWQHQFKEKDTKPAPFYVGTNETVTVPMMNQTAEFKSARSDDDAVEMLDPRGCATALMWIARLSL